MTAVALRRAKAAAGSEDIAKEYRKFMNSTYNLKVCGKNSDGKAATSTVKDCNPQNHTTVMI